MPGLSVGGEEGAARPHELRRLPDHGRGLPQGRAALPAVQRARASSASASTPFPPRTPGASGSPASRAWASRPTAGPGTNLDAVPYDHEPYFFHFPDGNATLARLLVRRLVPAAIPGRTVDDLVTARADYARLDEAERARAAAASRARSCASRHRGEPAKASEVEVAYVRGGSSRRCGAAASCSPAGTRSSRTSSPSFPRSRRRPSRSR